MTREVVCCGVALSCGRTRHLFTLSCLRTCNMLLTRIVPLLALLPSVACDGLYSSDSPVTVLTSAAEVSSGKFMLVEFYSAWCGQWVAIRIEPCARQATSASHI